jgi:hypothetical protein
MREIVHGPCQLIFALSRFFITPSVWMSPSIHRATHADRLNTRIKFTQARICFIFHYYGHFLFHALLNLQLPLARREEEVWPLNPYITESTSSNQCPDTRALILCIVCRIFHPSNLVSLCIMVVPIFSWDHSHIQKRACGMREGIVVGG